VAEDASSFVGRLGFHPRGKNMIGELASAIAVEGICYEYPGVRALDDVSFSIQQGGVTALVGPNGAGKTTLLRCIAGLDRPMLGTIELAGVDVLEEPRLAHERIGYLSDFYGLYDALSVRRALAYAAAARGVADGKIDNTVTLTAAKLEINELLDRPCGALSRGQRQRVAIGQALVHAPQVLLLDEPAAGLDPEARHALARLFTRLRDEGMTLVVSSHILAELDEYSTGMLVLRRGKVIEHRALAGAKEKEGEARRIRITFVQPVADFAAQLGGTEGIKLLESSASEVLIALRGNAETQASLLRALLARGLPILSFSHERENLHQSYLRTVRAEGEHD
jgi:ABC-2 type transport system ATP-binding protein